MELQNINIPTLFDSTFPVQGATIQLQAQDLMDTFSLSNTQPHYVQLILKSNRLFMQPEANSEIQGHQSQIYSLELTFNVKFQPLKHADTQNPSKIIGIKIFKSHLDACCFYSASQSVLEEWINRLGKKINQRGFHEQFKPLKKLGKGNFATVYQVQRIKDGQKFAVKAFSKNACYSAKNGRESLINQISIMRQLDHQNLIFMEGVYESDNSIYVVIELLTGGQFFQSMQKKNRKFTQLEIKEFMYGMLRGLEFLHSKRIMHRDLKPQNIMLRNKNSMNPVIVDYGLSTFSDAQEYLFFRCGTPGYVAPEIIRLTQCKHIEPECDIFSLGAIFHILLVGRHLFQGSKYQEVYQKNKQMKVSFDKPEYKSLDPQAFTLMRKMLLENPKQRIKAADALQDRYFKELQTKIQLETSDVEY